jgi:hypothetical protein
MNYKIKAKPKTNFFIKYFIYIIIKFKIKKKKKRRKMVENIPLHDIDLEKIPEYLSYEAMEAKYEFDLEDKDRFLGKGSFGQVHLFQNKNDR